MRRALVDAAARLQGASTAPQAFQQLVGPLAAAAAAGCHAAAARPLLTSAASQWAVAPARWQQQRGLAGLLPAVARHAAAAAPGVPHPGAAAATAAAAAGRRGYAQAGARMPRAGYVPPPEMQRAMQMRLSMVSPNLLAEPYRGAPPPQTVSAYFSLTGWKELWRRFLGQFKSLYTLSKCKKSIPGFDRKAFKGEALGLYRDVCQLLAAGDRSLLRQLVTPAVFSDMKRQLKQREDGGWARVHWELAREPSADQVTLVHARLIMIDPKDDSTGFAQMTVRIPSTQRFAAFNRAGQLVAGSLDKEIEVEDFWVLEHALKQLPTNRWRLAGRLSIVPHTPQEQQQVGGSSAESSSGGRAVQGAAQQQQQAAGATGAEQPEQVLRVGQVAGQQQQTAVPELGAKQAPRRRAAASRGRR